MQKHAREVGAVPFEGIHLFYAAAPLHKPKGTGASGQRVERKEKHPQHFRGLCVRARANAFGHFPDDSTRVVLQRRSAVLLFFLSPNNEQEGVPVAGGKK